MMATSKTLTQANLAVLSRHGSPHKHSIASLISGLFDPVERVFRRLGPVQDGRAEDTVHRRTRSDCDSTETSQQPTSPPQPSSSENPVDTEEVPVASSPICQPPSSIATESPPYEPPSSVPGETPVVPQTPVTPVEARVFSPHTPVSHEAPVSQPERLLVPPQRVLGHLHRVFGQRQRQLQQLHVLKQQQRGRLLRQPRLRASRTHPDRQQPEPSARHSAGRLRQARWRPLQ